MTEARSPATKTSGRMPVVFAGHGSPMNVIEDNRWRRGFAELGQLVGRPDAILVISAHWFVAGTYLTGNSRPPTIHDFSGFPSALYQIEYPAPGHVDLARKVRALIGEERAELSSEWGFDHGTWGVLREMFPAADIPVIQLSIDRRLDVNAHYQLARSLVDLRYQNVLILGSGNIVHNLRDAFGRIRAGATATPDWAAEFDTTVATASRNHDTRALLDLWPGSRHAHLAHPTPDHFLPLIYAYAVTDEHDRVEFPVEGFDAASISMRNIVFG